MVFVCVCVCADCRLIMPVVVSRPLLAMSWAKWRAKGRVSPFARIVITWTHACTCTICSCCVLNQCGCGRGRSGGYNRSCIICLWGCLKCSLAVNCSLFSMSFECHSEVGSGAVAF